MEDPVETRLAGSHSCIEYECAKKNSLPSLWIKLQVSSV